MARDLTLADLHLDPAAGEPRVRDIDLAEMLGFERPRNIRNLIRRHMPELLRYGGISLQLEAKPPGQPGRPEEFYELNEQQALLVCMFARTERAEEVREHIIRVYTAWRRGQAPAAPGQAIPDIDTPPFLNHHERNSIRTWQGQRDAYLAKAAACDERIKDKLAESKERHALDRRMGDIEFNHLRLMEEIATRREREWRERNPDDDGGARRRGRGRRRA